MMVLLSAFAEADDDSGGTVSLKEMDDFSPKNTPKMPEFAKIPGQTTADGGDDELDETEFELLFGILDPDLLEGGWKDAKIAGDDGKMQKGEYEALAGHINGLLKVMQETLADQKDDEPDEDFHELA